MSGGNPADKNEKQGRLKMKFSSIGTFRKIAFTVSMLSILTVGGKLVTAHSADANYIPTVEQKSLEVVIGDETNDVKRPSNQKLRKKRVRGWKDVQHDQWCREHYKGYSSRTGKYVSEQGKRVVCQSPFS